MKIISSIANTFLSNWGLKLLALTLAIVIYYSIKQEHADEYPYHDRSILKSN